MMSQDASLPVTVTRYYYEALGAPIVVFRNFSSYSNVDTHTISNVHGSDHSSMDEKYVQAISSSNAAVDAIPTAYPPQPWGRITPFDKDASRLKIFDATDLQTQLVQADRARTRYYINGLRHRLKNQPAKIAVKRTGSISGKRKRKSTVKFGVKMKRTPWDIISSFNSSHPDYHLDPRFPYIRNLIEPKSKLLPILPTLVARTMRQDMRYSSPKDGYCAPFLSSVIRYCSVPEEALIKLKKSSHKDQRSGKRRTDTAAPNKHPSVSLRDDPEDPEVDGSNDTDKDDSSSSSSSASVTSSISRDDFDRDEDIKTIAKPVNYRSQGKFIFRSKVIRPFPKPTETSFSPQFYSNCLSILPCPCDQINHDEDKCYSMFLFHPVGQYITITRINQPQSKCTFRKKLLPIIDVGGQVLQLTPCFDTNDPISTSDIWMSGSRQSWTFTARTSRQVIFLQFESSGEHESGQCSVSFQLTCMKKIDLPIRAGYSYIPLQLAARLDRPHPLVCPFSTLATISSPSPHSPYDEFQTNVIHHIIIDQSSEAQIREHTIEGLQSISLLEFSNLHPLVLWSAARSSSASPYVEGPRLSRIPTIGYGHSLYSIDLRSKEAALTWSPSKMEFCMERVHSISGIFPDACNPHHLYVSSISAGGKTWKIDCRMNSRSLCSWVLPGLCDDYKPTGSSTGVYGFGTIMTKPVLGHTGPHGRQTLPLISMSKSPGSYGFHVLQEPDSLPRFATHCLDVPDGPDGMFNIPQSFSTGTVFRNADSSAGLFTTGIAAFYSPASLLMDESSLDDLGYGLNPPSNLLCVVTATSIGDIFGYTLSQNKNNVEKRSVRYDDLPAGTSAVPVPLKLALDLDESDIKVQSCMWHLSNKYPATSSSIMKGAASHRSHCRPFISMELRHLNKVILHPMENPSNKKFDVYHHTFNETYMGEEGRIPTPLQLPMKYLKNKSSNDSENVEFKDPLGGSTDTCEKDSGRCDLKDDTIAHLRNLWNP